MPEVADWFETDQPTVVYRTTPARWPAEVARYALAGSVIIGCTIVLFAALVAAGILLVGLADMVLGMTWGVPAIVTAACLLPWRRDVPPDYFCDDPEADWISDLEAAAADKADADRDRINAEDDR